MRHEGSDTVLALSNQGVVAGVGGAQLSELQAVKDQVVYVVNALIAAGAQALVEQHLRLSQSASHNAQVVAAQPKSGNRLPGGTWEGAGQICREVTPGQAGALLEVRCVCHLLPMRRVRVPRVTDVCEGLPAAEPALIP